MAAKGAIAKDNIVEKLKNTFGNDFIGVYDKKVYLWADDGGEKVQIAISMTCPKNYIGEVTAAAPSKEEVSLTQEAFSVTPQEEKTIEELMAKLGL